MTFNLYHLASSFRHQSLNIDASIWFLFIWRLVWHFCYMILMTHFEQHNCEMTMWVVWFILTDRISEESFICSIPFCLVSANWVLDLNLTIELESRCAISTSCKKFFGTCQGPFNLFQKLKPTWVFNQSINCFLEINK